MLPVLGHKGLGWLKAIGFMTQAKPLLLAETEMKHTNTWAPVSHGLKCPWGVETWDGMRGEGGGQGVEWCISTFQPPDYTSPGPACLCTPIPSSVLSDKGP